MHCVFMNVKIISNASPQIYNCFSAFNLFSTHTLLLIFTHVNKKAVQEKLCALTTTKDAHLHGTNQQRIYVLWQ